MAGNDGATMATAEPESLWVQAAPALFVLLWSTGFIGAKFGLPYAEPFTFLAIRFAVVAAILSAIGLALGRHWPRADGFWRMALVGVLIHGVYLGGVFFAIDRGVSAGVAALIVGLQPVLTALLAGPYLGERVTPRQWLGFVLGFFGVALVVWRNTGSGSGEMLGLAALVAALLGITLATLYQKRHGGGTDPITSSALQFWAAAAAMAAMATALETREIDWTPQFLFALAWLVLVLSVGAISLLLYLIRRGAASRVASLFYLVPPTVAVEAYFLFGEELGPLALAGLALAVTGVALVVRGGGRSAR